MATSIKKVEKPVVPMARRRLGGLFQMERVLLFEEVRQHHEKREDRTHGRSNACSHNAHIQRKHEEVVTEYIEYAAEQHRFGGQCGGAVVA